MQNKNLHLLAFVFAVSAVPLSHAVSWAPAFGLDGNYRDNVGRLVSVGIPKAACQIFEVRNRETGPKADAARYANAYVNFLIPERDAVLQEVVNRIPEKKITSFNVPIIDKHVHVTQKNAVTTAIAAGMFALKVRRLQQAGDSVPAAVGYTIIDAVIDYGKQLGLAAVREKIDPTLHKIARVVPSAIRGHALVRYIANKSTDGAIKLSAKYACSTIGSLVFSKAKGK